MLQSRLASGTFEDPKNVIVFLRCGYFQKKIWVQNSIQTQKWTNCFV